MSEKGQRITRAVEAAVGVIEKELGPEATIEDIVLVLNTLTLGFLDTIQRKDRREMPEA
ncbi:MAG: hypothetical protein V3V92_02620 [Candidatus Hydrothermarchaeales archaeon]